MKCALAGVAGFLLCAFVAYLVVGFIVARDGPSGAYYPKELLIHVRVIDTDDRRPVSGVKVSFFQGLHTSLADSLETFKYENDVEAEHLTDEDGYTEVPGTFGAWSTRHTDRNRAYSVSGGWLKGEMPGRPAVYISLDAAGYGASIDYDVDEPLNVLMVMNKAP